MANKNLTGQTIADSYDQLLLSADEGGVTGQTASATQIICGTGTAGAGNTGTTPLYLSRDRVGIGTATQSQLLEVASQIASCYVTLTAETDNASYNSAVNFADAGGIKGAVGWDNGLNSLQLVTGTSLSATTGISILASGNVGIGVAAPTALLEVEQGASGGAIAFKIDNNDTDKVALMIEAANITEDVMEISADALTTAKVIDITADALTSGSILYLDDNSSSTTARNCVSIIQNNDAALDATALLVQSDAGGTGMKIDKNYPAALVAADTITGLYIDFDHTVPSSGTATQTDIGIDLDVNSATLGTSTTYGMDIDVVGATSGTHTVVGLAVDVGSADTNYAALFNGGNVGIGTTAPTAPLYVVQPTGSNNQYVAILRNEDASDPEGLAIVFSAADFTSASITDDFAIAYSDSNSTNFAVYSDGGVLADESDHVSDVRLKENIVDVSAKLDDLNKLKVRNFNYKGKDATEAKRIGFIADELETVFPKIIKQRALKKNGVDYTDLKMIRYEPIVAILVKAVQELSAKVTALENA